MNNDRELLQQWLQPGALVPVTPDATRILLDAIRARLSQCDRCGEVNPAEIHTCTPKQEPKKALVMRGQKHKVVAIYYEDGEEIVRAELPQREWVGLTDEEIIDCWNDLMIFEELALDEELAVSRAIEAALKEKNA